LTFFDLKVSAFRGPAMD